MDAVTADSAVDPRLVGGQPWLGEDSCVQTKGLARWANGEGGKRSHIDKKDKEAEKAEPAHKPLPKPTRCGFMVPFFKQQAALHIELVWVDGVDIWAIQGQWLLRAPGYVTSVWMASGRDILR